MGKKCTFVKLNNKTGKRAAMARHKSTKQSKANTEKIRQEKIEQNEHQRKMERLEEWNPLFLPVPNVKKLFGLQVLDVNVDHLNISMRSQKNEAIRKRHHNLLF